MTASRPQRVLFRCPVRFTHEDGVTGQGTMMNLSLGGCAIHSDTPVFDDMLVTLQFTPSEQNTPVSIELGRVRWATLHEFGVEFLMILPKDRSRLERVLAMAVRASGESGASPAAAA